MPEADLMNVVAVEIETKALGPLPPLSGRSPSEPVSQDQTGRACCVPQVFRFQRITCLSVSDGHFRIERNESVCREDEPDNSEGFGKRRHSLLEVLLGIYQTQSP